MVLYSTILDINENLTKDSFLELVIKWNLESPHDNNRILELQEWKGERNKKFGSEDLWLDIEEYRNKNIIAVRYEKKEADGAIWDTDYIMNFDEMRMAIRLDRSYDEDALIEDMAFSTPHFITMLIEGGYIAEDNEMAVLKEAITITEDNVSILQDVINEERKYRLPIVYIAKNVYNRDPVNLKWLCSKLKGVAHVLVESDKSLNNRIREICNNKNEYNGAIGIYYPNGVHQRFLYKPYTGSEGILINKVTRAVLGYINVQKLPPLYTWLGVNISLLSDRLSSQREERQEAEIARQEAVDAVAKYVDTFDDTLTKLQNQVAELTRANTSLQMENQGLRRKLNGSESIPVLYLGNEDEFYQGEIKEMLLDAIKDTLGNNLHPKTRRANVLKDVLQHNNYQGIREKRDKQLKIMFTDYKTMSKNLRQELTELGFKITEDGKHYRLTYYGDERYKTTIAKTGSDWREGLNIAKTIMRNMM